MQRDEAVLKEISRREKDEQTFSRRKFLSSVSHTYSLAEMKIVFREATTPAEYRSLLPN